MFSVFKVCRRILKACGFSYALYLAYKVEVHIDLLCIVFFFHGSERSCTTIRSMNSRTIPGVSSRISVYISTIVRNRSAFSILSCWVLISLSSVAAFTESYCFSASCPCVSIRNCSPDRFSRASSSNALRNSLSKSAKALHAPFILFGECPP